MKVTKRPSVEVHLHSQQYTEQRCKLPFSGVSARWYERQSELAVKNVAREKQRDESIVHTDVNLHWTTANVELYIDSCLDLPHCMVISRDAKAIIPTDISPAQHPGHTWKKRLELSHHAWDQLRTNVITPMTSTV